MNRKAGVVAAIVVGLSLVILIAAGLERVERTVQDPPGPEARANPFLAAERFFAEMGLEAETVRDLEALPPTDHVLILAMDRRVTTDTEARALEGWVDRGGMLIATPPIHRGEPYRDPEADPLLITFETFVETYDGFASRTVGELQLEDEEPAEVLFYDTIGLGYHDVDGEYDGGYSLLWSAYGDGAYAIACDLGFLRNREIGQLDHARFAWRLSRLAGDRSGVVIVRGQRDVSLTALLGRHAWLALLVGALGLIAWAWRASSRFGPLIPEPEPGSRSILEHVEATGRFLWRYKRHDALLAPARTSLLQRLISRRPAVAGMDDEARCKALARGTRFGSEEIRQALFEGCPHNREQYAERMRVLETLRRGL